MTGIRFGRAAGMLAVLMGLRGTPARAVDPSPQEVLLARGLEQDGKYFVLKGDENNVKAQLNIVLPLVDRLEKLAVAWTENMAFKFQLMDLDDQRIVRVARIQQIDNLLPQIKGNTVEARANRQALQQERDLIQNSMPGLRADIELVRKRIATPQQEQAHAVQVRQAYEEFMESYRQLTPLAKGLYASYERLKADSAVSSAVKVLRQSMKVNFLFGPSPYVQQAMNRVNIAKQAWAPDHFLNPQKKKRGKPQIKLTDR